MYNLVPKRRVVPGAAAIRQLLTGDPTGIRTRVSAVKGRCPNRQTIGPQFALRSASRISFPNLYPAFQSICSSGRGFGHLLIPKCYNTEHFCSWCPKWDLNPQNSGFESDTYANSVIRAYRISGCAPPSAASRVFETTSKISKKTKDFVQIASF